MSKRENQNAQKKNDCRVKARRYTREIKAELAASVGDRWRLCHFAVVISWSLATNTKNSH